MASSREGELAQVRSELSLLRVELIREKQRRAAAEEQVLELKR